MMRSRSAPTMLVDLESCCDPMLRDKSIAMLMPTANGLDDCRPVRACNNISGCESTTCGLRYGRQLMWISQDAKGRSSKLNHSTFRSKVTMTDPRRRLVDGDSAALNQAQPRSREPRTKALIFWRLLEYSLQACNS